jgi:ribosomal protein L11 methylase PrmA
MSYSQHESSFRDNDSVILKKNNEIIRVIYDSYKQHYEAFEGSGFMDELINNHKLISHKDINNQKNTFENSDKIYRIIKPKFIPFISYPYEWCFSQYKQAALLTLSIQLSALQKGLTLKDASAFNVQFLDGKPIFIDTTSIEIYEEGKPWVAYKQFCQHFLAPLLLYKYGNPDLVKLFWSNIDGLPLDEISKVLPFKTRFNFFVWTHIHYHAKLELKYNSSNSIKSKKIHLSKSRLEAFIQFLQSGIENLELPKSKTEWSDYYDTFSYSKDMFEQKKILVKNYLSICGSNTVLDIGCNDGEFSLIASQYAKQVVSVDFDYLVIENLFNIVQNKKITNITPLILDISNPSPAIGWANTERLSFYNRTKYDTILALAVIHHLAIGNNVPIQKIAELFASLCKNLIIEFVPKSDQQTQKLLVTKKDVFNHYTLEEFQIQFRKYFTINAFEQLEGSERILFFMNKHETIS